MLILVAIVGYFLFAAIITVSICMLSARMSRQETWDETPIVDENADMPMAPEYKTDMAASS